MASSWVTNVGDGIAIAAGPLLVASQTHNAILVALAGLLQRAPWLILGLYAGAVADRVDRRILVFGYRCSTGWGPGQGDRYELGPAFGAEDGRLVQIKEFCAARLALALAA